MRLKFTAQLLWLLAFSQLLATSCGFFFPMFGNFFGKFRNGNQVKGSGNGNVADNGGVSIFSKASSIHTGTGNLTSITVPMLTPSRRVDVVTTVISSPVDQPASESSPVANAVLGDTTFSSSGANSSNTDQQSLGTSAKLVIPTSTSVTSSISASQHGIPLLLNQGNIAANRRHPNTFTLPFTPNLFGIMSYVQALKDIKRNYKDHEFQRKIAFHDKEGGDLMTRILRTLIHKVVNKYQKQTEILKLKILKRQEKLQNFLQLPMVAQVVALDQARGNLALLGGLPAAQPIQLGKDGIVLETSSHLGPIAKTGKTSIVNSFLI